MRSFSAVITIVLGVAPCVTIHFAAIVGGGNPTGCWGHPCNNIAVLHIWKGGRNQV